MAGVSVIAQNIKTGTGVALARSQPPVTAAHVRIVLLSDDDSRSLWKGNWSGSERVFLTQAGLVLDGDTVRLISTNRALLTVGICPPPDSADSDGKKIKSERDGVFQRYTPPAPEAELPIAKFESVQPAGPLREIHLGKIREAMAAEPDDADFKDAAVWRIQLPANLDLATDPLLRFHYAGDVARITLNGKLVTDDFYNGNVFDIGLRLHAPEILNGDLRIEILPLRKDAPIYTAMQARPDFGTNESVVSLGSVEIIPRYEVKLTSQPANLSQAR